MEENTKLKKDASLSRKGVDEPAPSNNDPQEKIILNIKDFELKYRDKYMDSNEVPPSHKLDSQGFIPH